MPVPLDYTVVRRNLRVRLMVEDPGADPCCGDCEAPPSHQAQS